jgi:hypothetical protein
MNILPITVLIIAVSFVVLLGLVHVYDNGRKHYKRHVQ